MPAQDSQLSVISNQLSVVAQQLRADVLRMVVAAGAGHIAGPLSSADIFATLYFGDVARYRAAEPTWEMRDRVVLSCGHYCPILYAALAKAGYFPETELLTFMQPGSRLPGHPERGSLPGVEVSAGPLGQGVSVAVGMALALKLRYGYLPQVETPRVYCVLSDGEIQEGQVWEAFTLAVRRQLDNLIFIVDRNHVQIENYVSQLAAYGSLAGRFEGFGLYVLEADGHNPDALNRAFAHTRVVSGAPAIIIAETIAGKGVSFMERSPEWHDRVPTEEELEIALQELGQSEYSDSQKTRESDTSDSQNL